MFPLLIWYCIQGKKRETNLGFLMNLSWPLPSPQKYYVSRFSQISDPPRLPSGHIVSRGILSPGHVVSGEHCLGCILSRGRLSLRKGCLWGILSLGQLVSGAYYLQGRLSPWVDCLQGRLSRVILSRDRLSGGTMSPHLYILIFWKNFWWNSNFWVVHKTDGFKHSDRVREAAREAYSARAGRSTGIWCAAVNRSESCTSASTTNQSMLADSSQSHVSQVIFLPRRRGGTCQLILCSDVVNKCLPWNSWRLLLSFCWWSGVLKNYICVKLT